MRIFIVGLGLIGASYAQGLSHNGHKIYAYNRSTDKVDKAIAENIVEKDNDITQLSSCDVVILALYPKNNVDFVQKHKDLFQPGQIVTDVSGTKGWMMPELIKALPEGVSYTSHHPMAGKETSGYDEKDEKIFVGANFIIVPSVISRSKDQMVLEKIANDLKFGKILVVDANEHDHLIAFTSQLTHVLAISLVEADRFSKTKDATGDSYRDLTRIAKINETMWTELFLENQEALLGVIKDFKKSLNHMEKLIKERKKEELIEILRDAKEKRKQFDKN